MNGVELYRLGRRLIRLGVKSIPASGFRELPTSVRMVLVDVLDHPGSTITQIVERTGFPQSHVSASVARLREGGVLVTTADPADRRRTLVAPSGEHLARVEAKRHEFEPIDSVIGGAMIDASTFTDEQLRDALSALDLLARLLDPPTNRELALSAKAIPAC